MQAEEEAGQAGQGLSVAAQWVQVVLQLLQLTPVRAAFSAATPMDTANDSDEDEAMTSAPALPSLGMASCLAACSWQ